MTNLDYTYDALIGRNQSWGEYFFVYEETVKKLYEEIERTKTVDVYAAPFLFLVRHTLELGFKYNIHALSKYSEKDYGLDLEGNIRKGHVLPPLHKAMVDHFEELSKAEGKNSSTYIEFHQMSQKLGKLVNFFDSIDRGSFAFRYPTDNKGVKCFDFQERVNLKEIKEKYDESSVLLSHTQTVLQTFFDMIDDYRSQTTPEESDYFF